MDNKYINVKNKLNSILEEARELIEKTGTSVGFENKNAYRIMDRILNNLSSYVYELECLSRPATEGKLHEMYNGKFELIDNTGKSIANFSCGGRIEIYDPEEKEWHSGRIEHKRINGTEGYYFYCNSMDNPFLSSGMRARIRRSY